MPQSSENLLFVIPNLLRGGAEYQLYELCKSIKRNSDIQFSVLVFYRQTNESSEGYYEKIRNQGITVKVLFDTPPSKSELFFAIRQFLKENKPSVVQCFLEANEYLLIAGLFMPFKLFFGVRTFINIPWLRRSLLALLHWRVEAFVGNSKRCIDHYVNQFHAPKSKSVCIYNGIDASRFQIGESAEHIRAELGIPVHSRCFITVSNMHYECKGHQVLLNAWTAHIKRHPKDHLLLVGLGRLTKSLMDFVSAHDIKSSVHFLGQRKDVPRLLKACDIYVSPSFLEGFSNSIAEALLSGIPVIATNAGGAKELIDSQEKGVIIPTNNIDAIINALNDSYSPLTKNAKLSVQQQTNLDRLGREYIHLYEVHESEV